MESIFTRLLETELTAVCICAVIIIVRLFMKKLPAKYSYFMWAILLVRLLMPFTISSAVSMFNLIPDISGIYESLPQTDKQPVSYPQEEVSVSQNIYNAPLPVQNDPLPYAAEITQREDSTPAPQNISWKTVCCIIWLAGIAAITVYTAVSIVRLKLLLRSAVKRGDVMVCSGIDTPFVFGLMHPRIYIPENIAEKELPYIIAHERVHMHRLDYIIKPLAFAVLAVHWFDPVLWAAFRLMENDMERSCDEAAVAAFDTDVRKEYAKALLGISQGSRLTGARLVSFGNSSVKSRIKNILSRKHKGIIAAVTAVLILSCSAACMLTDAAGYPSFDGITQGTVGFAHITPSSPMGAAYTAYSPIDTDVLKDILKNARSAKAPVLPESYSQYNVELMNGTTTEILLHIPLIENERTVISEKMIWGSSAKEQRKASTSYYTLSQEDYDRLMDLLTQSDKPFPAGHYTGTDEHYEATVTENDDTKQIEIIMDRMTLTVLSVPQNYGLEMTNAQGMETAVYQGYGQFTATSAPISSLMIPCEFVYDERQSGTAEYTTHNDLYDKAEKQMLSMVRHIINDKNYFLQDKENTFFIGEDINYDFFNDWMTGTFTAAVYTSESDKIYMSFRFSDSGRLEYLGPVSSPDNGTTANPFIFTDSRDDTAVQADSSHLISHGTFRIDEVTEPEYTDIYSYISSPDEICREIAEQLYEGKPTTHLAVYLRDRHKWDRSSDIPEVAVITDERIYLTSAVYSDGAWHPEKISDGINLSENMVLAAKLRKFSCGSYRYINEDALRILAGTENYPSGSDISGISGTPVKNMNITSDLITLLEDDMTWEKYLRMALSNTSSPAFSADGEDYFVADLGIMDQLDDNIRISTERIIGRKLTEADRDKCPFASKSELYDRMRNTYTQEYINTALKPFTDRFTEKDGMLYAKSYDAGILTPEIYTAEIYMQNDSGISFTVYYKNAIPDVEFSVDYVVVFDGDRPLIHSKKQRPLP